MLKGRLSKKEWSGLATNSTTGGKAKTRSCRRNWRRQGISNPCGHERPIPGKTSSAPALNGQKVRVLSIPWQNKAPFGYSWKSRRILWTLYLKFKSFLIKKLFGWILKTKSAIHTHFKICQSAWCPAWDISLLSRYFYLSFLYTSPWYSRTIIWWPHNTESRTAAQRSFSPWRLLWGWRTF